MTTTLALDTAASDRSAKLDLRLRSRLPNRERWESRHVRDRPALASQLAERIESDADVDRVTVNPHTGRILIEYKSRGERDSGRKIRDWLYGLLYKVSADAVEEVKAARKAVSENPLVEITRRFPVERGMAVRAPTLSVVNNLVNFLPELALVGVVNVVNGTTFSALNALGLTTPKAQIAALGAGAGAFFASELGVERRRKKEWRRIAKDIEHRLRSTTYAHIQDLDLRYAESTNSGELFNTVSDNTSTVARFFEDGVDDALQHALSAAVIVLTLGIVSPTLALITVAPLPVIAYGSRFVQRRTDQFYSKQHADEAAFSRVLSNNLSDIATIKAFTAEDRERARIDTQSALVTTSSLNATEVSTRYTDLMRLLISAAFALAISVGGFIAVGGTVTPAVFTLLLFFVPKLLVRMEGIGGSFDRYQAARTAAAQILKVLDTQPTILSGDTPIDREKVQGHIEFDGVDFGYTPAKPVLKDFCLEIPAQSTVALIGSTGSGKSTIVKMLMRFYDVDSGTVMLDGKDLRDLDLGDLRRLIGFVSQDVFLFDGTARENIAYGRPDATEEEIIAAAKAAEAHEFINALPNGYDSQVGERGRSLSGGQRQRISIARAMLKDPAIFVFDEATSAVDNETEMAIQRSIERVGKDRTTILIAHRLSTVRRADRIIVLSHGEITESGTHDELLALDGTYAALWRVQTGEVVE